LWSGNQSRSAVFMREGEVMLHIESSSFLAEIVVRICLKSKKIDKSLRGGGRGQNTPLQYQNTNRAVKVKKNGRVAKEPLLRGLDLERTGRTRY